jgi:predicted permease
MFTLFRRLRARLKYRHHERDLAQELEIHRAMKQEDLEAHGLAAFEARPAAARALGNTAFMREEARAVWIARWMEQLAQDLRYAVRGLRRQPGFALLSILTLGVALGLLTSVFATFSALYLRSWDVPQSAEVFLVTATGATASGERADARFWLASFDRLSRAMSSADVVAAQEGIYSIENGTDAPPTTVRAQLVSDRFIETLRLPLHMGTGLAGKDHTPSMVISYRLWQDRFAGRSDVIGQPLVVSKQRFEVVGVLRSDFHGLPPAKIDVFVSLTSWNLFTPGWTSRPDACCVEIFGRVRSGFTRADANAELAAVGPAALTSERLTIDRASAAGTAVADRPNHLRQQVATLFTLLFAATTLVLALACANVGNLHLARGVRRERELAIRLSLGAGRTRVVRQLLTESLTLTLTAAAVGLGIATLLPPFVLSFDSSGSAFALTPDIRTYGFVTLAAVVACALFAVAPSLRVSRSARLNGTGSAAGAGRLRSVVLGVQVAVAVTLVTAATLLTRGVVLSATSDGGFALDQVAVATIVKPAGTYDATRSRALFDHVRRSLVDEAGLSAGLTEHPPLSNRSSTVTHPGLGTIRAMSMTASSFEVLGVPLLSGRVFSDDAGAQEVVVNQALATQLWPGQSAVGRTIGTDVVVGVAADARLIEVTRTWPLIFKPLKSATTFFVTVRTGTTAEQAVRQVVTGFDPRLTVRVAPVSDEVMDDLDNAIMGASVAGGLGTIALVLLVIGVFGVAAFIVEERRREIGIRLALGARRVDIRRALVNATRWPLAGGMLAGLGLSLLGGFLLRSFLIDVSPVDPISYLLVCGLMAGAGTVATWLPMRRAVRVDPAVTLRAE